MEPNQRPAFPVLPPQYSQSRSLGAGQISREVGGAQSSQTSLLAGWSSILLGGRCSVLREPPSCLFCTTRARAFG